MQRVLMKLQRMLQGAMDVADVGVAADVAEDAEEEATGDASDGAVQVAAKVAENVFRECYGCRECG